MEKNREEEVGADVLLIYDKSFPQELEMIRRKHASFPFAVAVLYVRIVI